MEGGDINMSSLFCGENYFFSKIRMLIIYEICW